MGAQTNSDRFTLQACPHPVDPVPLVPLKRQSPEEDTRVKAGWGLSHRLLEGHLKLLHKGVRWG